MGRKMREIPGEIVVAMTGMGAGDDGESYDEDCR
jgi:hypothetical protein